MKIPTRNNSSYELSTDTIRALQLRFPHAQVERELLLAAYWLEKNPARRPARPLRFVENWLSKASPKAAMVQINKWWESEQATLEQARRVNLDIRPGESWPELRARIRKSA